ncbi:hypothetical protein F5Y08DRAFT_309135 [Xylaria arbuscula]|nr:hypothetical protein F5Y08DRAFT_309135 [Xylaria arbuscula]
MPLWLITPLIFVRTFTMYVLLLLQLLWSFSFRIRDNAGSRLGMWCSVDIICLDYLSACTYFSSIIARSLPIRIRKSY